MVEGAASVLISPNDRAVLSSVRIVVAASVAPAADEVDRDGVFPADGLRALARAGLVGLLTPNRYGGAGASTVAYAGAVEEITAACASTSTVFMTQMHCAHPIELAGSEAQKRRCLPRLASADVYGALAVTEPGAGSDVAAMRTTARRDGHEYVLNGSKTFITSGDRAEVIVVFAKLTPSRGRGAITAFLLEGDPPGLLRGPPMRKMGLRGSSTTELFFDDCRLPADACFGGKEDGYALSMRSVIKSRVSAAAQGVGHAVGAYRAALSWAQQRDLLGSQRRDMQHVQFRLADMRARIEESRALLYATARLVDCADRQPTAEVSIAKLRCTQLGVDIATEAVDMLGGEGDIAQWGAERRLRDAKVAEIYDGTNEIQRMIIARDIRNRSKDRRPLAVPA
jgi:alkylation response protein AidB-like acyl-CoA dehydrogenase